eukprot:scaffold237211_cov48-Prasinocladus_malaysianus.AAC.1
MAASGPAQLHANCLRLPVLGVRANIHLNTQHGEAGRRCMHVVRLSRRLPKKLHKPGAEPKAKERMCERGCQATTRKKCQHDEHRSFIGSNMQKWSHDSPAIVNADTLSNVI